MNILSHVNWINFFGSDGCLPNAPMIPCSFTTRDAHFMEFPNADTHIKLLSLIHQH